MLAARAAIPSWFLTGVLRADLAPDRVDTTIAETLAWLTAGQPAWPLAWLIGPLTQPADLGRHLAAHGLTEVAQLPGMAMDLRALTEAGAIPATLVIEEVADGAALQQWADVVTVAFEETPAFGAGLVAIHTHIGVGAPSPVRHYLGRQQGQPVAAACLFLGAGVAGLYWVATLPEVRRQGLGTALTLAALRAARDEGYQVAILHAAPLGLPLYRRLGFQHYCTLHVYA